MARSTGYAEWIASALLKLLRVYTYNTPVRKGSSRLMLLALKLAPKTIDDLVARTPDGRWFAVDLSTGMHGTVFFFGEYEPFITKLVEDLIGEGDVCIDAGANFGWYTTLTAKLVGRSGSVHAFEPVPSTFRELQANTAMLAFPERVELNQLALSDAESEAVITLYDGLPTGHASLAPAVDFGASQPCITVRLDTYVAEKGIENVNLLKADVEGAELSLLKGAETLFRQQVPPIIVMEMALATSRPFGYIPNDLIEFIRSRADYAFYKIDEVKWRLIPIQGFDRSDIGANVLCVSTNAEERILSIVREYIDQTYDE